MYLKSFHIVPQPIGLRCLTMQINKKKILANYFCSRPLEYKMIKHIFIHINIQIILYIFLFVVMYNFAKIIMSKTKSSVFVLSFPKKK